MSLIAWKSKDPEGDVWCEDVIVFRKEKSLEDVFTKENILKIHDLKDTEYNTVRIKIHENRKSVSVFIGDEDEDGDITETYCKEIYFQTHSVLLID